MYIKTIEFEDYEGNKIKDDFAFNMNKAELTQWMVTNGNYNLADLFKRLSKESRGKDIMDVFEDFLRRSYGRVSLDKRRFEKSEEIWLEFKQTEAYAELFMELVGDGKKAAEFITAVIPDSILEEIMEAIKENPDGVPDEVKDYLPEAFANLNNVTPIATPLA